MAPKRKTSGKTPRKRGTTARRPRLLRRLVGWSLLGGLVALGIWAAVLDARITSRFEGRRWQVPSRVFARPLELFDGASVDAAGLREELTLLRYQRRPGAPDPGTWDRSGERYQVHLRPFDHPDERAPAGRVAFAIRSGRVEDFQGGGLEVAGPVRLEPLEIGVIYPAHKEDRILVRLPEVPPLLTEALVTVEDRRFREHHGVVPSAIARAAWANFRAGRVVQGGSTLTQQLVKNFFLGSERTLGRKATEAVMALVLEVRYEKDELLEAYLNEVYLGQAGSRAIHGFGLGARFFFGRSLGDLTVDQLAVLVGLVKGPAWYDPRRHPDRALERRNLVLDLLEQEGVLDAKQARAARERPLGVIEEPSLSESHFPAYLDLVRRHLARDYADDDLRSEGLRIFTALDPQLQRRAEHALGETLRVLEGKKAPYLDGAVVVTGAESGEVAALVGGRDPRLAGFNRALDAVRPIGSLVKPAVVLAALSRPERYTLLTTLKDEPLELELGGGRTWRPQNYDGKSRGDVSLHRALAASYNVPMVRLGLDLGLDTVAETLQSLGVERPFERVPALLLGALPLTPLEVARLYQTFSTGGFDVPQRAVREVVTAEGQPLTRYPYEVRQVATAESVHLVQYALQETAREGTARAVYGALPEDLGVAAKTGTTNEGRDSWFAGFTGDWLTVAWVGRDDNEPTGLTGSSGALRVWLGVMRGLDQRGFEPLVPEGVRYEWIDEAENAITDEACREARYLPFLEGSAPEKRVSCRSGFDRLKAWFQGLWERR